MALTQQVGLELGGSEGRFARGSYLTDGNRLFRVVARVIMHRQAYVELEDCTTLTTMLVAQAEVSALRAVRPEPAVA